MGSIYFKLSSWSQNNFESVPIDSNAPQISIGELKQLISKKKKLAPNVGLIITNATTNEEYKQETDTIQRNSSVIVKVVPNYSQGQSSGSMSSGLSTTLPAAQSGGYKKILPPGYTCHRCGVMNVHHASECPTLGDTSVKKKPQTMHGVPRSFLNQDLTKGPSFKPNEFEFDKAITAAGLSHREQNSVEIPAELKCSLCNKMLQNAVSIPCCMASSCDECIRSALLEEENDFHCPLCRNPVIPDNLIANKTLRVAVEDYLAGQHGAESKATESKETREKKKPKDKRGKPRNGGSPERKRPSRERSRSPRRSPDRNRDKERSEERSREKSPSKRGERERERDKERERERGDRDKDLRERERRKTEEREERDRDRERRDRDSRETRETRERDRGDRERDHGRDRDRGDSREKRKSRENSPDQKRERSRSENKRSRH